MAGGVKQYRSHGSGDFKSDQFGSLGDNVVFERGVLIFHAENIHLGSNIYIGHNAILKGYHKNILRVGNNSWIGQQCFLHAAGGLEIGKNVGIGPGVRIITSVHEEQGREIPVLFSDLRMAPVTIEDDSDLGVGSVILPGVTVGRGCVVGAGAVVTRNLEAYSIAVGVPARVIRKRA